MTYVDGFVLAVPNANKEAFREQAEGAVPMFKGYGAARLVEAWGDDVPRGEVNDLWGAVQAKDDETVLFSWIEYPDKATRQQAYGQMHANSGDKPSEMPFDGQRMVWSGFEIINEAGPGGKTGYIDGVILPVPSASKDRYLEFCRACADAMVEQGATRVVDGWGDDLMDGKVTDYHRAVLRKDDENVVYSWIEWPDKATRDAGWEKLMQDDRLAGGKAIFDGKRMIFGGFTPIVDG
jgi:uncharacterized protein YbaA (DUF1428 family)